MKICLAILLSMSIATAAFAKNDDVITGSTSANLVLAEDYKDDYKPTFNMAFGYDHVYAQGYSIGGTLEGSFGDDYSTFKALVGPGYNFTPNDVANSYNVDVKIGFIRSSIGNNEDTEFAAAVQGGKRFKLAENVSYAPGVEVSKTFADDAKGATFTFNVFRFAFIF